MSSAIGVSEVIGVSVMLEWVKCFVAEEKRKREEGWERVGWFYARFPS